MKCNILTSLILGVFFSSCDFERKDNIKIQDVHSDLNNINNSAIRVYGNLRLNDNVSSLNGPNWKILNRNIWDDEDVMFFMNNSLDDELAIFYNLKFDFIRIKVFNDSIAEIFLSAKTPSDFKKDDNYDFINEFTIEQVFDVFKEKYGKPHSSVSNEKNDRNKNLWHFPNYNVEILSEKYELSFFTPFNGFKKKYDDLMKKSYSGEGKTFLDDWSVNMELESKILSGEIQGKKTTRVINNLEIKFESKYFAKIIGLNNAKIEKNQLRIDSLKRVKAKEKI